MPIHVVSAVDENNLPPLFVLAASMAAAAKPLARIHYHVLYSGPSSCWSKEINGLQFGAVEVHLIQVDNPFHKSRWVDHISPATNLRLLIPEVLTQLGRVIYLDADVIVLKDLTQLAEARLEGCAIAGVPDLPRQLHRSRTTPDERSAFDSYYRSFLGLRSVEGYVNAGVLLMDLERLRTLNFSQQAIQLLRAHEELYRSRDQDVINSLLQGNIRLLDPRWNAMTMMDAEDCSAMDVRARRSVLSQRRMPYILHYASGAKPWSDPANCGRSALWWFFARRCPVKDRLANVYAEASGDNATQLTCPQKALLALTHWRLRNIAARQRASTLPSGA